MNNQQEKFIKNWINLIFFGVISFSCMILFIYLSGIHHSEKSSEQFDDFVKEKFKNLIKSEVLNRIDEIDYDLNQIIKEENLLTKQKIIRLKNLLLTSEIMNISNPEKRKRAAISKIEYFVKSDPDYLYFIASPTGHLLRSGTDNRLENINLINAQDKDGVFYMREIIKSVNTTEGIYVTYNWPKEKNGNPIKKTSFCLYLPEFDFIIGTGSYEEDVYQRLKESTFNRIQSYYKEKNDYIFIIGYDGFVKVHANLNYAGENIDIINNDELKRAHNIIMQKLETGDGFVSYHFNKKNSLISSEKITYVHAIDQWQVYIGMGFHIDDTTREIRRYREEFKKEHFYDVVEMAFILTFVGFISFLYIQNGLNIQKKILKQEDIVFEQLLQLTKEGVIIISKEGKILYKNNVILKIFKIDIEMYLLSDTNKYFKLLEEDVYSFKNIDKREYFLKMNIESILYHGKDCQIFIIDNITEQYIRENELQNLAYYDPLTTLPNRRKFTNDFEDIILNTSNEKNENIILAMLDLDHFKIVNDEHGHETGDKVLVAFGKFLGEHLRKSEYIYRFGGEEFVIIFKGVELKKVKSILEGINHNMSNHMLKTFRFSVTFSAGAVDININSSTIDIDHYFREVDKLLYQAKNNGRKKVEIILNKNESTEKNL